MQLDKRGAGVKWRLIPYKTEKAVWNPAWDESILEHVQRGLSPPTLRFYGWDPSAVVIGYFQCLADEVDLALAKEKGVHVVRRITGGGACFLEEDLTYSVIAPESCFSRDILKSYEEICSCLVRALKKVGIEAVFRPINDVWVGEKKISGSAQTRKKGAILHHGTLLWKVDPERMFSFLKVDKVKLSDKFIRSVKKSVTSILDEKPGVKKEEVLEAMKQAFLEGKEFELGTFSESEKKRAEELVKSKYEQHAWNHLRV